MPCPMIGGSSIISVTADSAEDVLAEAVKLGGELIWSTPERIRFLDIDYRVREYWLGAVLIRNSPKIS